MKRKRTATPVVDRNRTRDDVVQDAHRFGDAYGLPPKHKFVGQHRVLQRTFKHDPVGFQLALCALEQSILDTIRNDKTHLHAEPLPDALVYDRIQFTTLLATISTSMR